TNDASEPLPWAATAAAPRRETRTASTNCMMAGEIIVTIAGPATAKSSRRGERCRSGWIVAGVAIRRSHAEKPAMVRRGCREGSAPITLVLAVGPGALGPGPEAGGPWAGGIMP